MHEGPGAETERRLQTRASRIHQPTTQASDARRLCAVKQRCLLWTDSHTQEQGGGFLTELFASFCNCLGEKSRLERGFFPFLKL